MLNYQRVLNDESNYILRPTEPAGHGDEHGGAEQGPLRTIALQCCVDTGG